MKSRLLLIVLLLALPTFAQSVPQICWTQAEPLSPFPFVQDWRLWINGVAQAPWPRSECTMISTLNPTLLCSVACTWCHDAPVAAQAVGTVLAMDALDGGSVTDPHAWSDLSNTKAVVATSTPTPSPQSTATATVPPTATPQRPAPPVLVKVQ